MFLLEGYEARRLAVTGRLPLSLGIELRIGRVDFLHLPLRDLRVLWRESRHLFRVVHLNLPAVGVLDLLFGGIGTNLKDLVCPLSLGPPGINAVSILVGGVLSATFFLLTVPAACFSAPGLFPMPVLLPS